MFTTKKFSFSLFLLISILSVALSLSVNLVQQFQDQRSKASEEGNTTQVSFKIAFKGTKPNNSCVSSLQEVNLNIVNITNKSFQSETNTTIAPIPNETNQAGDQVFLVSNLPLNPSFKNVDSSNYFQIKSPLFLSSKLCLNHQSTKANNNDICNLNLTNGGTYDFSNYPLIPGDLNQDGVVNTSDFSIIKSNIDSSAQTNCNKTGDINFDGIVNSLDIGYLKTVLLTTSDEDIIDTSTITPTPTNTPTPTMSPQKRSLKAQQLGLMKYWLYLPNGYTKDKEWPLVVWLHGRAETGTNINQLLDSGLPAVLNKGSDYDAVIIAPQYVEKSKYYSGKSYHAFIRENLIPNIVENYNIDTDKIGLVGHSMGANGTVEMASSNPRFFSCLVTISLCTGYGSTWYGPGLANENLWAFHGNSDPYCGDINSTFIVKYIKAAGGKNAKVTIINGGHTITNTVFKDYKAVEWMIKQVRGQPATD